MITLRASIILLLLVPVWVWSLGDPSSHASRPMYARTISAKEHTERSLGSYLGTLKFIDTFTRTVGGKNVVISPEGNFSYEAPIKNEFLNRLTNNRYVTIRQRWWRTSPTSLKGSIQCDRGNILIEVDLEVFPKEENSIMYTALRVSGTPVRTSSFATPAADARDADWFCVSCSSALLYAT